MPDSKRARVENSLCDKLINTPRLSDSPLRVIQLVDKRMEKQIEKQTESLKAMFENMFREMFKECENRLLNEIDKKLCEIRLEINDVTERLNIIETVESEIDLLKKEIKDLKIKSLKQANSIVACDLRLNNVPFIAGENLYFYFEKICQTLNIPMPPIKTIFRLQNRNNKVDKYSQDAVIIVKLMSPYDRNYFLKTLTEFKRKNKNQLTLNIIGLQSNANLFITENLTHSNYITLQEALKLKRKKFIYAAYSFRGLIYVKKSSNDEPICIDHLDVLNQICGNNENLPGETHAACFMGEPA